MLKIVKSESVHFLGNSTKMDYFCWRNVPKIAQKDLILLKIDKKRDVFLKIAKLFCREESYLYV